MATLNSIIAAVDTRQDVSPIVEKAVRIANSNGASLKIVDVVPDVPWIARLMIREHANLRQVTGRNMQQQLEAIASSVRNRGIDVITKVLWGNTSVEIIREVLRGRHDAVLAAAKGDNSRRTGFFGTTARRLLRDCPCAVWLVDDAVGTRCNHVMACINTSTVHEVDAQLNARIYELASMVSRQHEARCSIVQAWRMDNESILKASVSERDFEELMLQRREYVTRRFNEFLTPFSRTSSDGETNLLKGEPDHVIPAFAQENDVDLIVMGTVARSGFSGMVIGNTVERILNDVKCSVLAVKPDSFVSPIKEAGYIDLTQQMEHAS